MVSKYRIAIIGTGVVANFMASFMLMQEDFDLIWVASQNYSNARRFAESFFVKNATDDYTKIPTGDIDIVYVATWADTHSMITDYFLSRGIHVLCEKPYALNLDEYINTNRIAKEHGVFFLVNVVTAYVPGFNIISSIIEQYGPVYDVNILMGKQHILDDSKLFSDLFFGGVYRDLSSYVFCFLRRIFGQEPIIKEVTTQKHITGVDVLTQLSLEYGKGPNINCTLTLLEDIRVSATFRMKQGVMLVDEFARVGSILLDTGYEKKLVFEANHHFFGFEYVFDTIRTIVDNNFGTPLFTYNKLFEEITNDIQRGIQLLT